MSTVPDDLGYSADHEWVRRDGEVAEFGVTEHAAEALGDVVHLELPAAGDHVTAGDVCGEIESTKSVSDIVAPLDGEVVEVNHAAVDDPAVVNSDPYGAGWLVRIRVTDGPDLLTAEQYTALVAGDRS